MSLALLLAVFNSRAAGLWLRETGVPLRGGYVRLKTAYLEPLPAAAVAPNRRGRGARVGTGRGREAR